MRYRFVIAFEQFVEAESEEEAKAKWEQDEVLGEPEYCYLLTIEPQEKEDV